MKSKKNCPNIFCNFAIRTIYYFALIKTIYKILLIQLFDSVPSNNALINREIKLGNIHLIKKVLIFA